MYVLVDHYRGKVPLAELAKRLEGFEVAWAPSNYGTTVDHFVAVRDAFKADLAVELPGEWYQSMLVVLRPDSFIRYHADLPQRGIRHHVVLATNPLCWCLHGKDWQQLEVGGVYQMDETVPHAAVNFGQTDRIHLVVDLCN